jgi:hypothetical protein
MAQMVHSTNQAVPIFPNVGNTQQNGVLFVSASRAAATYNSPEHYNYYCKGIRLYITNDAAGGSTATVKIQVRSPKGSFTDLAGAASAGLGAVTASIVTIYPGLTGIADVAGITINQHLGLIWRAVLTIGVATGTSLVEADYLM